MLNALRSLLSPSAHEEGRYWAQMEQSDRGYTINDPDFPGLWGSKSYHNPDTGLTLTPDDVIALTTARRCVEIIASALATAEVVLQDRKTGEPIQDHPILDLIEQGMLSDDSGYESREFLSKVAAARGNAFGRIRRNYYQRAAVVDYFDPDHVELKRDDEGRKVYKLTNEDGKVRDFPAEDIIHLRALSNDGLLGIDPISSHCAALGVRTQLQIYLATFYRKGGHPFGFLTTDEPLTLKRAKAAGEEFADMHAALRKSFSTGVLGNGFKWQQVGASPEDAEFAETVKLSDGEICNMFGVDQYFIGNKQGLSYKTPEHIVNQLIAHTLSPWGHRWCGQLIKLLSGPDRKKMRFRLLFDPLRLLDALTKISVQREQLKHGIKTPNELRHANGDAAYGPWGDKPLVQANNMAPLELVAAKDTLDPPKPAPGEEDDENGEDDDPNDDGDPAEEDE